MSYLIKRGGILDYLTTGDVFDSFFNFDMSSFGSRGEKIYCTFDNEKGELKWFVPGVETDKITVTYENSYLILNAEDYKRSVYAPNLDPNGIVATHKDGVLTIKLAKKPVEGFKVPVNKE